MEDAHWLDSASWALLHHIHREITPLLLVIATRPFTSAQEAVDGPIEYQELLNDPQAHHLTLSTLPAADILALVCQRLGVAQLPPPVADLIRQKAEGHPFFSEELAYALRDTGLIEIEAGQCRLAPGVGDLRRLDFPDTLQGVITSRIDRLTPSQQLALKVASVIGRVFAFRLLRDVHPLEADKPYLPDYLDALARLDLTPLESPEPELSYIFKHIITQEVAYNLMAFAQRRQLHQAVAEWYEHTHIHDLSPFLPLLAYHWSQTGITSKAVDYLLQAGDRARSLYAHQEAIDFYRQALTILKEQGQNEKAARTLMKLGQTYAAAFDFSRSQEAYQEGFKLWGQIGEVEPENMLPPAPHALRLSLHEPTGLDPALDMDTESWLVGSQLFRGLVEYSPELDIIPAVAHSWEISADGRRYVFHLREDVTWSDGTSVTAADFQLAWLRVLDPTIGAPLAEMLFDIRGARAFYRGEVTDSALVGIYVHNTLTLEVSLEEPTAYFLHLLTHGTFSPLPQHIKASGAIPEPDQPLLTNGPFLLNRWEPGQTMILSRNPTWYGRFRGNVQQVELFFSSGEWSLRWAKYQANDRDVFAFDYNAPPIETDFKKEQYAQEYRTAPPSSTLYIGFDVRRPRSMILVCVAPSL